MAFTCLPYGNNLSRQIGGELFNFYSNSGEGCCGCLETTGKWMLVAPAHLLTAAIVVPALMIYDLVLTLFFALANLLTAFVIEELRDRFTAHLISALKAPTQMWSHAINGLLVPCAYRGVEMMGTQTTNFQALGSLL